MSGAVGNAGERGRLTGRLVIATHNAGKLREFDELLRPFDLTLLGAAALGLEEPEETGSTFRDNAVLKARAAAQASGLVALSDDSGLCVEALDGAPGIYSARWAGPTKDFGAAMARVESELKARAAPPPWRAAFVSVLALAWPDGAEETFEGRVDGILVFPPRGTAGFGYDPIFLPDGHDRTFGEMSSEEKHGIPADGSLALSHRARAFQKFARARPVRAGASASLRGARQIGVRRARKTSRMRHRSECAKARCTTPRGRNWQHILYDNTADECALLRGRLVGYGFKWPISTARLLFNDYGIRWVVIAIAGLVSAIGLWKLNITIAWEFFGRRLSLIYYCFWCCNLQRYRHIHAPRTVVDGGRVGPVVIDFAVYSGVESLHTAHLPCCHFWISAGGQALTRLDATLFGFEWDVEANWVANHPDTRLASSAGVL